MKKVINALRRFILSTKVQITGLIICIIIMAGCSGLSSISKYGSDVDRMVYAGRATCIAIDTVAIELYKDGSLSMGKLTEIKEKTKQFYDDFTVLKLTKDVALAQEKMRELGAFVSEQKTNGIMLVEGD